MRLSIRQSLPLFACFLLVSLYLVGCGGSTSATNSMTLKVAQNSNAIDYFSLYVAQQENFIKDQGLTLDPSPIPLMGNATKMTAAVESGAVDVAAGTITDAFTLSKVDSKIKLLGALSAAFTGYVVVSKSFEQQTGLTATSSLADKVNALRGKKVGVPALRSAMEGLLTYLFTTYGYNFQKDATEVNLGASNPVTALGALRTGRVDAIAFPLPAGEEAEQQDIGDIFISPIRGDVPAMQGQINTVLYARQDVISTRSKAVQALIRALAQAQNFIRKNPTQAMTLLAKYLKLNHNLVGTIATAAFPGIPQSPQVSQQGYDVAAQFHVQAGLIKSAPSYNTMVATSTINQALG